MKKVYIKPVVKSFEAIEENMIATSELRFYQSNNKEDLVYDNEELGRDNISGSNIWDQGW